MRKQILSTILIVGILASVSISMTGCGKKEEIKPVESVQPETKTENITTKTEKDGVMVTTTKNGNTKTTTKTYKEGNVTYEIIDTETTIEDDVPRGFDGYKIMDTPDINLSYIGDAINNGNHKAKLNAYEVFNDKIVVDVETDIQLTDGFYIINSLEGEELIEEKIGLVIIPNDDNKTYKIEFDRTIFENNSKFKAEWKDNDMFLFLYDEDDNFIIIDPYSNFKED